MAVTTANDIMSNKPNMPLNLEILEEKLWPLLSTFVVRQADSSQSSPRFDQETDDGNSEGRGTKRALGYLFISLAILLLGALMYRRLLIRARQNQLRNGGLYGSGSDNPYTPRRAQLPMFDPYNSQSYPPRWGAFPAAHLNPNGQTTRRTRAEDIDAGGRRIGDQHAELDHGQLRDKDALPAYEMNGGPPRYTDVQPLAQNGADGLDRPVATNIGMPTPDVVGAQTSPSDPHLFPLPHR